MKTERHTAPKYLPVSLAEAKKQLNIMHDADDDFIYALISSATSQAEQFLRRKIVKQQSVLYLDSFLDEIKLPWGMLREVSYVKYTDITGVEYTLSTDIYGVDTVSEPGRIVLTYGKVWPFDPLYSVNPIKILFTHGFDHGTSWESGDPEFGDCVIPSPSRTTGFVYECTASGTTGDTEPVWPYEIGLTVMDGTVEWTAIGPCIPEPIRNAIKILITDGYENRESMMENTYRNTRAVESLLTPYRVYL